MSFAAARSQKDNRPRETETRTILNLKPHDYQLNHVNIDSIHHCGIFGAESLTSLTRNVFGGEERRETSVFAG